MKNHQKMNNFEKTLMNQLKKYNFFNKKTQSNNKILINKQWSFNKLS